MDYVKERASLYELNKTVRMWERKVEIAEVSSSASRLRVCVTPQRECNSNMAEMKSWSWLELKLVGVKVGWSWCWSYWKLKLVGVEVGWNWRWLELKLELLGVEVGWSWSWSCWKLKLVGIEVGWNWSWLELKLELLGVEFGWIWLELKLVGVGVEVVGSWIWLELVGVEVGWSWTLMTDLHHGIVVEWNCAMLRHMSAKLCTGSPMNCRTIFIYHRTSEPLPTNVLSLPWNNSQVHACMTIVSNVI